jgi:hydrogenase maturation protease
MTPLLVIGIGNDLRGDDAAGLLAARRLAARRLPGLEVRENTGDTVALAGALASRERVVVIDAVAGRCRAGAVLELTPAELDARGGPSSHGLGLREALALSRVLGGRPEVRVIGIGGRRFGLGDKPSPEVRRAAERVARQLEEELACA